MRPPAVRASVAAGFWRRFGALAIDTLLLLFLSPAMLLLGLVFAGPALLIVALVLIVGYFALLWGYAQSLGMRLVGIRVVRRMTGARPGAVRGFLRASLVVPLPIALYLLAIFAFSDPPAGGYSAVDCAVLASAAVASLAGVASHLTMLLNEQRLALHDRLAGLQVIRAVA